MNLPTLTHRAPLNSDDHFDRPFSLMAMKGKLPKFAKKTQLIINLSKII
jgi:hypothetical protein